ncbi:MAG: SHOCT domain-containing protein [Clostridia bacterium]|nr:SHOCT domain-containing protein [Clostridia bacterium]
MRIEEIKSIDENINGLTKMGQFRIQGITETFVINIFKAKIVDDLRASICKVQEMQKTSNTEISNNYKLSSADEIMKFKQLLDDGIITQEEFERKKKELLK